MPEARFEEAPDLERIGRLLAERYETVGHVECGEVLFLREWETEPKALARCYRLVGHPIRVFTEKKYAIVVYESNCDYLTAEQLYVLILHEMMHIPMKGDKLIDHDVKDFHAVLDIDLHWADSGAVIPNILEGIRNV